MNEKIQEMIKGGKKKSMTVGNEEEELLKRFKSKEKSGSGNGRRM